MSAICELSGVNIYRQLHHGWRLHRLLRVFGASGYEKVNSFRGNFAEFDLLSKSNNQELAMVEKCP